MEQMVFVPPNNLQSYLLQDYLGTSWGGLRWSEDPRLLSWPACYVALLALTRWKAGEQGRLPSPIFYQLEQTQCLKIWNIKIFKSFLGHCHTVVHCEEIHFISVFRYSEICCLSKEEFDLLSKFSANFFHPENNWQTEIGNWHFEWFTTILS